MGKAHKPRFIYAYHFSGRADTWSLSPYCYVTAAEAWAQAGRMAEDYRKAGTKVCVEVDIYRFSPEDDEQQLPLFNPRER